MCQSKKIYKKEKKIFLFSEKGAEFNNTSLRTKRQKIKLNSEALCSTHSAPSITIPEQMGILLLLIQDCPEVKIFPQGGLPSSWDL